MVQLTLILDNLRSAHNVGAILRTCDATGVDRVLACDITPYPRVPGDLRDPVVIARNTKEIAKTALGAEVSQNIEHYDDAIAAIDECRVRGCTIIGLEQAPGSTDLFATKPHSPIALVVGNETAGLAKNVLAACDHLAEIPQRGKKESLNVSVATGIALYHLMHK